VTTNFQVLYEKAAAQPDSDDMSMTWQPMDRRQPWMLKMHGDIDHRE